MAHKGLMGASWIAEQVVDDMRTAGLGDTKLTVKADQEASSVELHREMWEADSKVQHANGQCEGRRQQFQW